MNLMWHDSILFHSSKASGPGESIRIIEKHVSLKVDGMFGENTEKCVNKFQKYKEVTVNGIVTDHIWSLML